MTYTFKLSRRVALLRDGAVMGAFLFTLSCTGSDDLSGPGPSDLNRVVISPSSTAVGPNQSIQFEAVTPTLSEGGLLSSLVWTATGGTVDSSGKYAAGETTGTYQVIVTRLARRGASNWDIVADTAVVTIAAIAQIVLSPASVSIPAGASVQFTAEGKSADNASVSIVPRYTATGGTIPANGLYTAGQTAGDFWVIATDSATQKADTSAVTITPPSPAPPSPPPPGLTLEAVVLTPTSVTLDPGANQQFTAVGKMSDGSTSAISVAWSASAGIVSSAGLYTAGQAAGTFRLIATQTGGTLADTADVTVTATQPPSPPPSGSCVREVPVSTVSGLTEAVNAALPGDCIRAAVGTYAIGVATWSGSGTASQPITLEGTGSSTVFTLGGNGGIYLKASHWRVRKLRITNGFFGLQLEGSASSELDSLEIDHMKQAAVNLRYGTHHSSVRRSWIHNTGEGSARYGEGVYIGGWAAPGSSLPDEAADDNQVLDNRFGPNVRAEAIDISRGADRVIASGNVIDGTGTVFEDGAMASLIGVRGVGHQFNDNVLSKGAPHGVAVWEGEATFRRNRIALFNQSNYSAPLGINRAGGTVTVYCDNVVTDIPQGGAAYNVPCTP